MRLADIPAFFALRPHLAAPWAFLRLRSRPPKGAHFEVPLKDGGSIRMRTHAHDRHILMDVYRHDEYRLNGLAAGAFGTVIDIGGHVGTFACRAAPIAGRVLVYEPAPDTFALLVHNTARFANVKTHQLAVAAASGMKTFFLSKSAPMNSMFGQGGEPDATKVEVRATTLAEIFKENQIAACDLLKIDCEGAEYEILYELASEYWAKIARIYLEYHPVESHRNEAHGAWSGTALAAFLEQRGYTVTIIPSRKDPRLGLIFAVRRR